jgi:ABC-type antimicrobial peptide transport system permease subunit
VQGGVFAWDRYAELRREPLPNAVIGTLYTGFWIALALGLLDFGFYMAMSVQRRATMFAVLRAMGWNARRIWGLLTIEQLTLVLPALVVGVGLGAGLAFLLLPFLALLGQATLMIPVPAVFALLLVAALAFGVLLSGTAALIGRMSLNQVLRQE